MGVGSPAIRPPRGPVRLVCGFSTLEERGFRAFVGVCGPIKKGGSEEPPLFRYALQSCLVLPNQVKPVNGKASHKCAEYCPCYHFNPPW